MANLTEKRNTRRKISNFDLDDEGVMSPGATVYQGGMCQLRTDGLFQRAGASGALHVLGRSRDTIVNAATGARVRFECGIFAYDNDGTNPCATTHIGEVVYMTDDHTVANTGTVAAGIMHSLDPDTGEVFVIQGWGVTRNVGATGATGPGA
jgi:hypothetical protein